MSNVLFSVTLFTETIFVFNVNVGKKNANFYS